MVAACGVSSSATVTTAAAAIFLNHHNSHTGIGTAGGGGGGGCKKDMEANSGDPPAVPPKGVVTTTTAEVEQLRQQLQSVVENGDLTAANACVEQLENAVLSKDTLEATRIGRFVNDIRKLSAQKWPDFSKRCRALIKQWQKVAEYRPGSSCEGSSNGGTPQLVSPALKRGLTPRMMGAVTTPGKRATPQKRVTSTGLCPPTAPDSQKQQTGRLSSTLSSSSVSPVENGVSSASGSYAPLPAAIRKKGSSPRQQSGGAAIAAVVQQQQHSMHKSASVGAALSCLGGAGASVSKRTVVPLLNGIAAEGGGGTAVAGRAPAHLASASSNAAGVVPKEVGEVKQSLPKTVPSALSTDSSGINPPLMLKLKRSASGVQRLTSSLSPPSDNGIATASTVAAAVSSSSTITTASSSFSIGEGQQQQPQQQSSVLAARKNVQSTAQLMAQLSMALPHNIGIDLSNKQSQQQPPQQQQSIVGSAVQQKIVAKVSSEPIPTSADGVKRRYQKRKGGRASEDRMVTTVAKQSKLVADTGETFTGVKEEEKEMEYRTQKREEGTWEQQRKEKGPEEQKMATPAAVAAMDGESHQKEKDKEGKRGRKKKKKRDSQEEILAGTKFNWFAELSFDNAVDAVLAASSPVERERQAADQIPAQVYASPTRSFVLPAHERNVLLLPYMDIGLPDWRVHNFPQSDQFLFPEPSEWHRKPS